MTVSEVAGIINGTGNFILTEMTYQRALLRGCVSRGSSFGYAEADPTFDVDGTDAAHKLVILASLAFGLPLDAEAPLSRAFKRSRLKTWNLPPQWVTA
jgi:homoserine dehydrogenase